MGILIIPNVEVALVDIGPQEAILEELARQEEEDGPQDAGADEAAPPVRDGGRGIFLETHPLSVVIRADAAFCRQWKEREGEFTQPPLLKPKQMESWEDMHSGEYVSVAHDVYMDFFMRVEIDVRATSFRF